MLFPAHLNYFCSYPPLSIIIPSECKERPQKKIKIFERFSLYFPYFCKILFFSLYFLHFTDKSVTIRMLLNFRGGLLMDKKTTGIVSYITLIGWLIAFCAGDKEGAKFHLNQSLVLYLASLINSIIISRIPICGWAVSGILSIVFFIFWIMGLVYACKDEEKELPLLGSIKILN